MHCQWTKKNPLHLPATNFPLLQACKSLSIVKTYQAVSLSLFSGTNALFHTASFSAGMTGFLFMLRALVSANFNTIYIYTAEVGPSEGT